MKIAVGLSGGVDSAVTAYLLKEQGHDVFGVTMAIWNNSTNVTSHTGKHACFGPEEQDDINEARALCNELDIPFQVYDCSTAYKKIVLDYFKREYLAGRTPNPCIQCNQQIKLDVLPTMIQDSGETFDKFATGHYARVEFNESAGRFMLKKALDSSKDQTYFLYRLTQTQLEKLLLPLGEFEKTEVRKIARDNQISLYDKSDSQDFYSGDYNDLIDIRERTGNLVHVDGRVLGQHKGVWNYTIGQRKGLGVSSPEPLYVINIDAHSNQVVVGPREYVYNNSFLVDQLNWIAFADLKVSTKVNMKIRSSQQEFEALIEPVEQGKVKVTSTEPQSAITPGQSAVFYQDDLVLGGGIIDRVL